VRVSHAAQGAHAASMQQCMQLQPLVHAQMGGARCVRARCRWRWPRWTTRPGCRCVACTTAMHGGAWRRTQAAWCPHGMRLTHAHTHTRHAQAAQARLDALDLSLLPHPRHTRRTHAHVHVCTHTNAHTGRPGSARRAGETLPPPTPTDTRAACVHPRTHVTCACHACVARVSSRSDSDEQGAQWSPMSPGGPPREIR
jgi:hypothetical protein